MPDPVGRQSKSMSSTWLSRNSWAERTMGAVGVLALRARTVTVRGSAVMSRPARPTRSETGANILAVLADNSQGLAIVDRPGEVTRGERLRTDLIAPRTPWLEDLHAQFQVRPYVFDDELRRVSDFAALDFTGPRSDLGHALDRIRERFADQPLAGVLLFTDGNATDLTASLADATGLPPLYPVVVGETADLRDLRLRSTLVGSGGTADSPPAAVGSASSAVKAASFAGPQRGDCWA